MKSWAERFTVSSETFDNVCRLSRHDTNRAHQLQNDGQNKNNPDGIIKSIHHDNASVPGTLLRGIGGGEDCAPTGAGPGSGAEAAVFNLSIPSKNPRTLASCAGTMETFDFCRILPYSSMNCSTILMRIACVPPGFRIA